jgi:hypothetical protein
VSAASATASPERRVGGVDTRGRLQNPADLWTSGPGDYGAASHHHRRGNTLHPAQPKADTGRRRSWHVRVGTVSKTSFYFATRDSARPPLDATERSIVLVDGRSAQTRRWNSAQSPAWSVTGPETGRRGRSPVAGFVRPAWLRVPVAGRSRCAQT